MTGDFSMACVWVTEGIVHLDANRLYLVKNTSDECGRVRFVVPVWRRTIKNRDLGWYWDKITRYTKRPGFPALFLFFVIIFTWHIVLEKIMQDKKGFSGREQNRIGSFFKLLLSRLALQHLSRQLRQVYRAYFPIYPACRISQRCRLSTLIHESCSSLVFVHHSG